MNMTFLEKVFVCFDYLTRVSQLATKKKKKSALYM